MSPKRPVHPMLIVLPLAAFTLTTIALAGHAATANPAWYRVALIANLGGLALSVLAIVAALFDAATLPRFTVARSASLREVGFTVLALILFAATATATANRYDGRALGDVLPLALAAVGLVAIGTAGWYGHVVQLAFKLGHTIVRYPARMLAPARQHPGSARTIV